MLLYIVSGLILGFWFILFLNYPQFKSSKIQPINKSVSILIAFKDEAHILNRLLEALENQEGLVKKQIQIVFVNDHSTDNGPNIIEDWFAKTEYQGSLLHLTKGQGKKKALRLGAESALHDIFLFTDADCIPDSKWIIHMLDTFMQKQADLLIGTVWYKDTATWFGRLQQLEFAVLQSITALSIQVNWPFMCNGANLMTYRTHYLKYLRESSTEYMVSGDDIYYLEYLIKNKRKINYGNSSHAIVETYGEKTRSGFINQRLRWSSKIKYYKHRKMILPSLFFSFWSVSLLPLIVMGYWYSTLDCLVLIGLKFIIDYSLMSWFYNAFNRTFKIADFIILGIIYPIYVFYIGFLSFFKTFTWKNRLAKV